MVEMAVLIEVVSAAVPGLLTGLVLAYWNRKQKQRDDHAKEAEEERMESDYVRIDLEVATAQLSYAVAMAYKRGTPNGEMETAIEQYEKAMERFRKFERRQIARGTND